MVITQRISRRWFGRRRWRVHVEGVVSRQCQRPNPGVRIATGGPGSNRGGNRNLAGLLARDFVMMIAIGRRIRMVLVALVAVPMRMLDAIVEMRVCVKYVLFRCRNGDRPTARANPIRQDDREHCTQRCGRPTHTTILSVIRGVAMTGRLNGRNKSETRHDRNEKSPKVAVVAKKAESTLFRGLVRH